MMIDMKNEEKWWA